MHIVSVILKAILLSPALGVLLAVTIIVTFVIVIMDSNSRDGDWAEPVFALDRAILGFVVGRKLEGGTSSYPYPRQQPNRRQRGFTR